MCLSFFHQMLGSCRNFPLKVEIATMPRPLVSFACTVYGTYFGIVVKAVDSHSGDPGSIPGGGSILVVLPLII